MRNSKITKILFCSILSTIIISLFSNFSLQSLSAEDIGDSNVLHTKKINHPQSDFNINHNDREFNIAVCF